MSTIVKIQKALFPPGAPALIYDQHKRHLRELDARLLPDAVRQALKTADKVYWVVNIKNDDLVFLSQAKAQPW